MVQEPLHRARRLLDDSLRRYEDLGALGQPPNLLQQLLPPIQFNEV